MLGVISIIKIITNQNIWDGKEYFKMKILIIGAGVLGSNLAHSIKKVMM